MLENEWAKGASVGGEGFEEPGFAATIFFSNWVEGTDVHVVFPFGHDVEVPREQSTSPHRASIYRASTARYHRTAPRPLATPSLLYPSSPIAYIYPLAYPSRIPLAPRSA